VFLFVCVCVTWLVGCMREKLYNYIYFLDGNLNLTDSHNYWGGVWNCRTKRFFQQGKKKENTIQ
jgi:hypothetical protein